MAPCTHPGTGMKRLFFLKAKAASIALLPRPCLITSREVNEARGGLMLAAGRVRSKKEIYRTKKNTEKSAPPPKTRHEIHSNPAIASNSRRHARKHIPRVSPYSPASIDPGFVEIGLVQLSQSVKTNRPRTALTISKNESASYSSRNQ